MHRSDSKRGKGVRTIICLIPNLGMGGAQRVFSDVNSMLQDICRVVPVAFSVSTGTNEFDDLDTIYLEVEGGSNVLTKGWNFLRRIWTLRRLKKELKAEFTISHMEGANFINILSGVTKNILVVHGSKVYDEEANVSFRRLNHFLIKNLYNRATRVVTVSKGIRSELISLFGLDPNRCIDIPNSFDIESIALRRREELESHLSYFFLNNKVLINTGRLHESKNHKALIEIFYLILMLHPYENIKLVLLGDGPLKTEIIERLESLGLRWSFGDETSFDGSADVVLMGNVNNPFKYIHKAKLFLFPSKWEGFPLALCEALLCGTMAITSDYSRNQTNEILGDTGVMGDVLPVPLNLAHYKEWQEKIIERLNSPYQKARFEEEIAALGKQINRAGVKKRWIELVH